MKEDSMLARTIDSLCQSKNMIRWLYILLYKVKMLRWATVSGSGLLIPAGFL
jgi:hypothetical protein